MITLEKVNQSIDAVREIAEKIECSNPKSTKRTKAIESTQEVSEEINAKKLLKHYVALLAGLMTVQNLLNRGLSEAFFEKERAKVIRAINNYEIARSAVGFGHNRKELLADLRAKHNPTLLTKQMGILNYILQIRASNDLDAIAEVPNKAMLYESIQAQV